MKNFTNCDQHKVLYVSLSFDDGYLSHYDVAKCLAAIGIRATFFVTTHWKKKNSLASAPERIVDISDLGHEIGSHTCTHTKLLLLSPTKREYELRESKRWLEELIGKEIKSFAYPYYSYNDIVLKDTHRFYSISRSRNLHIGTRKINLLKVRFLDRKSVLPILSSSYFKNTNQSAMMVLHDLNSLEIALLLCSLKLLTQTMSGEIRFVTLSELAQVIIKNKPKVQPEINC